MGPQTHTRDGRVFRAIPRGSRSPPPNSHNQQAFFFPLVFFCFCRSLLALRKMIQIFVSIDQYQYSDDLFLSLRRLL